MELMLIYLSLYSVKFSFAIIFNSNSSNCDDPNTAACLHGGTCIMINGKMECKCPQVFFGKFCQHKMQICPSSFCNFVGDCYTSETGFNCICSKGFVGPTCDMHSNRFFENISTSNSFIVGKGKKRRKQAKIGDIIFLRSESENQRGSKIFLDMPTIRSKPLELDIIVHDKNRDPCLVNSINCKNGGTCRWLKHARIKCECRIPYFGKNCSKIDLCQLGPGRCIDDVKTRSGTASCYPCPLNSRSCLLNHVTRNYECDCGKGQDCFAPSSTEKNINDNYADEFYARVTIKVDLPDSSISYVVPKKLFPKQRAKFVVKFDPKNPKYFIYKWVFGDSQWQVIRSNVERREKRQAHDTGKYNDTLKVTGNNAKNETELYVTHYYDIPGDYLVKMYAKKKEEEDFKFIKSWTVHVTGFTFRTQGTKPECKRILPMIVCIILTLYFFLFTPYLCWDLYKNKCKAELIVETNIYKFPKEDLYYVKTQTSGIPFFCITSSNLGFRLIGSKGSTKPFYLKNRLIDTLSTNSEDEYLISCPPESLGEIEAIQIWKVKNEITPLFWYCTNIIVKNVKTDELYFFFVDKILREGQVKTENSMIDIPVASVNEALNYFCPSNFLKRLFLKAKQCYLWLAPFCSNNKLKYWTPFMLTVIMFVVSIAMITLIAFMELQEGFPGGDGADSDQLNDKHVIKLGLVAAAVTFPVSTFLPLIFLDQTCLIFKCLIAWTKEPIENNIKKSFRKRPRHHKFTSKLNGHKVDKALNTKSSSQMLQMKKTSDEVLYPYELKKLRDPANNRSHTSIFENKLFRIPSTDMLATEFWVNESIGEQEEPDAPIIDTLTHKIKKSEVNSANLGQKMTLYGLIGGATIIKDENAEKFVYKTRKRNLKKIDTYITKEVRAHFDGPQTASKWDESDISNDETILTERPSKHLRLKIQEPDVTEEIEAEKTISSIANMSQLTSGQVIYEKGDGMSDESNFTLLSKLVSQNHDVGNEDNYFLCHLRNSSSKTSWMWIHWNFFFIFIMVAVILVLCILVMLKGGKYGCLRTHQWCHSFGWTIFFSLFLFQPLKVMAIALLSFFLEKPEDILQTEITKEKQRFQLLQMNGLDVLPQLYQLRCVLFIPSKDLKPPGDSFDKE